MNRRNTLLIIVGFLLMLPTLAHAQFGFDLVSVEAYINDHKQQRSLLLVRSTLEASNKLTFASLTGEQQDYLCSNYPFYKKDVMPAGSYNGVTEDIPTISEWNMLVTSTAVDADYVYLMTKTLLCFARETVRRL